MPPSKPQQQLKDDERRQHGRMPVGKQLPMTATAGGKIFTCYIDDISLGGLKLRFEGPVPEGKVIALDHPVAGTLCGRCAWRDGSGAALGRVRARRGPHPTGTLRPVGTGP